MVTKSQEEQVRGRFGRRDGWFVFHSLATQVFSTDLDQDDDEPEWIVEHARAEKRQAALRRRQDLEKRLARIRAHEKSLRDRHENGEPCRKRQVCRRSMAGSISD